MAMREQLIAYPVALNRAAGRIAQTDDYDAYVAGLIRQVLLTGKGERINRPEFGASVARLVFAPILQETASLARATILEALTTWLSEFIEVQSIDIVGIDNGIEIRLVYRLIRRGTRRYLNVEVTL
nr:Mlr6561 protein [uncultured bacterium]